MKLKVIASIVLLLTVTFFSLGLQSVSAQIIHYTPIGKTIVVASNETFILAYKMEWNDPANPGYFLVTVYWDVPTNASHLNFTYVDFVCKFTDGTPVPEARLSGYEAYPGPGFVRYILQHGAGLYPEPGVDKDGAFWLNVTMRAAGVLNGTYIPHADGDQDIAISKVRCRELTEASASGKCIIHVGPGPPPPPPPPPPGPIIIDTPINDTIPVVSGETFVLPFKMKFNDTEDGFFWVKFYWDNNENDLSAPYWNFTYEDFVCKFTDGTEFSVPINVTIRKDVPTGYPLGYYRYMITIFEKYGEPYDGDFFVDVTMRAAGVMNSVYYPHAVGDQNITIFSVYCAENYSVYASGICTIHVIPPPLPAVGGTIVPVDKLELLMPYIGVVSVILVTITVVVKKRKLIQI